MRLLVKCSAARLVADAARGYWQAEQQEAEHRRAEQQQLVADIYDDIPEPPKHQAPMGKAPDISDWLADISQKDSELRKNADVTRVRTGLPPVRNAERGPKKRVQVGQSSVEKEKEKARGDEAPKGPSSKQQKYYSYDYFKEWDKFDVDKEIERIEEEEKKQEEYKGFSKKSADVDAPEEVHDPSKSYSVDDMTPLEKRMASKREKEKGNECMKAGEINAAVGFYSKALELVPGDHLILGNRAQAYIGIKCFYQAELDCDTALLIEPTYAKARYRRAVAREEQGKLEAAKQDYDILLREQPEHTLGQQKLAVLEVKLRRKREAEEAERKAEEERQKYDAAPRRKIQITELDDDDDDDDDDGMDAEALKKAREAVKQREEEQKKPAGGGRFTEVTDEEESEEKKSRKLKFDAEERLLKLSAAREKKDLGNERFKAKDLEGAIRHYTKGLDILPADDAEERHLILCNRALVYLQQNKPDAAEADCSEAIKLNSKWAKAWHRRGVARYKDGRLEAALEDLEQALKLEPNSKSTIDEIKIVQNMQLEERKKTVAAAASSAGKMRVQIEEVETDSEDDDVVVVTSPGSAKKTVPQADKDTASPPSTGPGAAAKKVQVVEVDDDDESDVEVQVGRVSSEDEGEVMDDDAAVSIAPPGAPPAGKAVSKVAIEEVDSEDEDEDDSSPPSAPTGAAVAPAAIGNMPIAEASPKIQIVEVDDDSDEDEVEEEGLANARAAWEEAPGVDVAKLRTAKKIKEEADDAFKRALFEKGATLYSSALEALGFEEDTLPEQAVCCLNRAACNLQVREYGQVIADCGQVLDFDPENVKAYLRRGLAYEGSSRFTKAAADMRDALSIEFASGGLTALGNKAKECLERCKKAEPDLRSIPIPVRNKIVKAAGDGGKAGMRHAGAAASRAASHAPTAPSTGDFLPAPAFTGSKDGYAFKQGDKGLGYYRDTSSTAAGGDSDDEDIRIIMDQTGVDRARAVAALQEHKDAAGAVLAIEDEKDATSAAAPSGASAAASSGQGGEQEPSREERAAARLKAAQCLEAEDHKNKGNMAFKAGKHRSAIMHYSAAIDLDDSNPTYYTNLAAAHNALKDYDNGLKMALAARRADPSYAKGIYRQAQALQGLGRLREALKAYEEGLALIPESTQMLEGRKEVSKAIRDAESSELNALAKLKAIKEAEAERQAAEAKQAQDVAAKSRSDAAPADPKKGGLEKKAGAGVVCGGAPGAPKSGSDIKRGLRNMRKDMPGLFKFVSLCVPSQLPALLSSGLEEDELVMLIRSVAEHGAGNAPQESFVFLEGLVKVPRVAIVTAMLDRKDSKMLEAVLLRLHPSKANEVAAAAGKPSVTYDIEQWANLRKTFGV